MRLKMMGGGDSIDYDSLTATAADVVEGLNFIGFGSEDEQVGQLPNMEKMQDSPGYSDEESDVPVHYAVAVDWTVDTNGNKQVVMAPPWGKYPGNKKAWIGCYPEDIGIIAAIIAVGEMIGDVEGTYGSDGNLVAKDLRAGKIGYGSEGRVIGGATDYGAVSKTLAAGESYTINEGIYSAGKVTAKTLASQTSATAIAAYILEAYTAWVNGVLVTGTMPDLNADAEITHSSSNGTKVVLGDAAFLSENSDGTKRVEIRYNGDPGYLKANTLFAVTQAVMASAIGLTAAKLATGQSVLSITGSYKGVGDAVAENVLAGKTFSSASLSGATGTMTDKTDTTTAATPSLDSTNSRLKMTIPTKGCYDTSSVLYATYSTVRNLIGLTAAKLGYGKTCLGLTGTYKPTIKQISAIAACGFGLSNSDSDLSEEDSYTCTAAGTCYYNGFSASEGGRATVTCEIYKNGSVVNSRNIDSDNDYCWRGTMQEQSFSVAKGDVIKVVAAVTFTSSAYSKMSHIDATIVCYE